MVALHTIYIERLQLIHYSYETLFISLQFQLDHFQNNSLENRIIDLENDVNWTDKIYFSDSMNNPAFFDILPLIIPITY